MAPVETLFYVAAHAGFSLERVPLGGGGTIAARLEEEWRKTKPFPCEIITPAILGTEAPCEKDLVRYSEWRYARFCRAFEWAATQRLLRRTPPPRRVLCNDVSEGPDFRRLAEAGVPLFTIYHVDVVDYFCRIYLRGWIRPEQATRLWRRLETLGLSRWVPGFLDLVFQKQADSVHYSRGLIVMTAAMKELMLRCYPQLSADKVHVLPWGVPELTLDSQRLESARASSLREFPDTGTSRVIISVSRITPEKGQDRLLEALALWERQPDYPAAGVCYFLVGEAAYMQGKRFEARLRRLAKRLKRTTVYFTGYRSGEEKQALLERAQLYVFPSRHESYGLTLLEAMQAGLPVLSTATYGAAEMVTAERGALLPEAPDAEIPRLLQASLAQLLADPVRLKQQGVAAQAYARTQRFSDAAARLAYIIETQ